MGQAHLPEPVLLVVAAFSRHEEALEWARQHLTAVFGPIALASPLLAFDQTRYYEPAMGPDLRKQFIAFADLVSPDCLPRVKNRTNVLEEELAQTQMFAEPRPINLDPGLLCLGKFLLATTKDQAHRIYLGEGIYGEVTLRFHQSAFEPWPWTYADYRTPAVGAFLKEARDLYRRLRQQTSPTL